MTTATLASFLLARLDEDEAVARAAVEHADSRGPRTATWEASNPGEVTHVGEVYYALAYDVPSQQVADHIARHDPARVLADVEAKRVALDWYLGDDDTVMEPTIRALASVYADHPDYDPAWSLKP